MEIPPDLATAILNAALQVGKSFASNKAEQARVTGVFTSAAMEAIEACGHRHDAGSPVWKEVSDLLGSSERAVALLESVVRQESPGVSVEATEYVNAFAANFVALTFTESKTTLDTKAILAAIGVLKGHLTAETQVAASPLAGIPWYRRPGAPVFRVNPGLDGKRMLLTFALVGGNEPGDITAAWSINDGPEVFPLLMVQNGPVWARQAKPADCRWSNEETGQVIAHLRIRFVTPEGEHGYHWWFPIDRHEKGHWVSQTHLGSTLHTPEPF